LLLTVHNSGVAAQRDQRVGAVGLANTRARLLSLYGGRAEVKLAPDAAGGSRLSLRLPAEFAAQPGPP
jgi:LytS/YehU family sensor histidine kinase